jgi:hypothetical protein
MRIEGFCPVVAVLGGALQVDYVLFLAWKAVIGAGFSNHGRTEKRTNSESNK